MDSGRWNLIQELFHQAAAREGAEREVFLREACGGDLALADAVVAMLNAEAAGPTLLDRSLPEVAHRLLDSAAPGLPAQQFGPYRLVRLLGEGGMGVVYLAEREDLGSVAAVKVLRDAWLSPSRRDRFLSEQRMLAQLAHPAIARLFDADTLADGTPWFAMEYVEGLPITEHVRSAACPIPERLRLFRAVCEAVQHAHRHLVVHRDLKPSNMLITGEGAVKLLDFGIAKQLDEAEQAGDLTRTGLRFMTPAYAAPEQVRGRPTGVHTDVYALGVLLYELLTGQLPIDVSNRTPAEAASLVADVEPERPSLVARRTGASRAAWADLDVLCLTAMRKDPSRRYRSVDALLRDVEHYLAGEPLEARPDALSYRTGKFVRRHWRPLLATAAAMIALVGVVAFYTWQLTVARTAALGEAARTQRIQAFMLNLFEGDEAAGPPESLRVITLVDKGVQEARTLDREPAVQAELYETLGGLYEKLGSFDRAEPLLVSSLKTRESLLGGGHPDVGRSEIALGLLRSNQAKLEEAEALIRRGLAKIVSSRAADHPSVLRARSALGHVLQEQGKYAEAIQALGEAAGAFPADAPPSADLADILYELASVHFYAGHYDESDVLNRRVLDMVRHLHGDSHPDVASALVNLGATQHERGRYKEAERLYRQALDITLSWYGSNHYQTAATLTMLGRVLLRDERPLEAAELLDRALRIREQVFGPMHPQVASTVNELGTMALLRGDPGTAESHFSRMAAIYRAVHGDNHYLLGIARSNLASVYVARKEYSRAEAVYREVIAHFTRTLSADHLNTGIARLKLGRALVRQQRHAEAEPELLAGHAVLERQTEPTVSWLRMAREDLVTVYEALGQPQKAGQYR